MPILALSNISCEFGPRNDCLEKSALCFPITRSAPLDTQQWLSAVVRNLLLPASKLFVSRIQAEHQHPLRLRASDRAEACYHPGNFLVVHLAESRLSGMRMHMDVKY